ncbi:MAG TPA: hypothetical protein PKW21_01000 [Rhabdaerophilum sp.]|nr:hypothetical protein [Rhabdaerophilum sp.]
MSENSQFSVRDLDAAVAAGLISAEAAERLRHFLVARASARPVGPAPAAVHKSRFDLMHVLWYAGALITMSAMGLFSTLAFSAMGGAGLTATGLIYGLGLWYVGHRLWQSEETRTPGGLLIAAAISMVPLAVFGIQSATNAWAGLEAPGTFQNFYHYIKAGWIPMELATIAVSALAARRYSFAFIAFPAAFCLWFLSMDIAAWIAQDKSFSFSLRRQVSLWFGIVLFFLVWIYELRPRKADFAFWLHLVAAITFWGGLTFQSSSSEIGKFLYCLINVGLVVLAIYMGRRVYAVFGVIGIMTYLGHLAYEVFKDSLLFPFALSAFGLAMVAAGIWLARRRDRIAGWMEAHIPAELMALRPYAAKIAGEAQRSSSLDRSPSGSTG